MRDASSLPPLPVYERVFVVARVDVIGSLWTMAAPSSRPCPGNRIRSQYRSPGNKRVTSTRATWSVDRIIYQSLCRFNARCIITPSWCSVHVVAVTMVCFGFSHSGLLLVNSATTHFFFFLTRVSKSQSSCFVIVITRRKHHASL